MLDKVSGQRTVGTITIDFMDSDESLYCFNVANSGAAFSAAIMQKLGPDVSVVKSNIHVFNNTY